MTKLIIIPIALLCLVFIVPSCEKMTVNQAKLDYDKLCEIYEDIAKLPIELGMKELKLTEKIKKQLPVFFVQHYVHISATDRNKRYNLIKQVVDLNIGGNWECLTIKIYYEGIYD